MQNTLVYYTVGYSPVYIDVLALSIQSLRDSKYMGDIAVLCDASFLERCRKAIGDGVRYIPLPDSKSPEEASMSKLRIFDIPSIDKYDKVLFLDSDILIDMDVNVLVSRIVSPGKLYVYNETREHSDHNTIYWSLCSYTPSELLAFEKGSVHVFNAGCFAFIRDDTMKEHFSNILSMIANHKGAFFYEQSFMNVYFNKNGHTDRSLFTDSNYKLFPKEGVYYPGYIIHFSGSPGGGERKLQRMIAYKKTYLTN